MGYDYGRKFISKKTGLTGIESMNIAKQLNKQNIDFQSIDWETIGHDLYGHGKRTGGVKHHLKQMYAITLDEPEDLVSEYQGRANDLRIEGLMNIFESRSRRSKLMDLRIKAKHRFRPSDERGVKLWKKYPNQFDIIGVDD